MEVVIAIFLAFTAGVLVGFVLFHQDSIGNLRVDHSDTDGNTYLFLELDTNVPAIENRKYVMFRVKNEDFIPHE